MIPQHFIMLEKMPYTLNGKIDKKALPDFNSKTTNNKIVNPRNKTDEELITILEKMLNTKQISLTDTLIDNIVQSLEEPNNSIQSQTMLDTSAINLAAVFMPIPGIE